MDIKVNLKYINSEFGLDSDQAGQAILEFRDGAFFGETPIGKCNFGQKIKIFSCHTLAVQLI